MSETIAMPATATAPRLGFLGVGWIGRSRMQSLAASGAGHVAAIADASAERAASALEDAPGASLCDSFDAMLEQDLEGIVIATPSALHARQAIRALERGLAVFCQKPLACTAADTSAVIAAARSADCLLGVDLSYRATAAMRAVRDLVQSGSIGQVFAVDLTFHNAYGPDRGWARDPALSGGGCVIDLGIHLLDLALWVLGPRSIRTVQSQLYAHGRRLTSAAAECEDFATATLDLDDGTVLRLACSWEVSAGRDAIIEVAFHGAEGGAAMRNLHGSFFDFTAEHYRGASTTVSAVPPDPWPGRALTEWSIRLARDAHYDAEIESLIPVAAALDAVLGR